MKSMFLGTLPSDQFVFENCSDSSIPIKELCRHSSLIGTELSTQFFDRNWNRTVVGLVISVVRERCNSCSVWKRHSPSSSRKYCLLLDDTDAVNLETIRSSNKTTEHQLLIKKHKTGVGNVYWQGYMTSEESWFESFGLLHLRRILSGHQLGQGDIEKFTDFRSKAMWKKFVCML